MYNNFINEGWRCPQCGKIWSPSTSFCCYCNSERTTFATTTTLNNSKFWDDYAKRGTLEPQRDNDLNWWLKLFNINYPLDSSGLEQKKNDVKWEE